jgi:K+-transporting ATPase ATPase C chain
MHKILQPLRHLAVSVRLIVIFTVILGLGYPLAVTAIAQLPGLKSSANGSLLERDGKVVGSTLLGQSFTDANGKPLPQYLQSRPSAAGAGYDPTASSAGNLGPESIVDTLPDPSVPDDAGKPSLLTAVCSRSAAIGTLYGVDGSRPFCTSEGVGAVLAVFWSDPDYRGHVVSVLSVNQVAPATPFVAGYRGVAVSLDKFGTDISAAQLVPVRGSAPSHPAVPADAVTSSGSGLDPEISPAYARLQEAVMAKARGISPALVAAVIDQYTSGRDLGFIGEPKVNVLRVNAALDARYPVKR